MSEKQWHNQKQCLTKVKLSAFNDMKVFCYFREGVSTHSVIKPNLKYFASKQFYTP